MKDTELIYFELFERYPDVLTVHQAREALGVGRTGSTSSLTRACSSASRSATPTRSPRLL